MLGAYMDDLNLQPEHLENALSQIDPAVRSAALQVIICLINVKQPITTTR